MSVFHIDSITAREIAEWASSIRGKDGYPVFFVAAPRENGGGLGISAATDHSPCSGSADVVIPCSTRTVQPARKKVSAVHIRAEGMDHDESLDQYDSVFWSEAAVEKFLFPYYASKFGWKAAHVLAAMAKAFYGYVPGADPAAEGGPELTLAEEEVPFAMAHIPRSDYVTLEEPVPLGGDVALLFKGKDGKVVHRRMSEFL
jgi:hypothetical protein